MKSLTIYTAKTGQMLGLEAKYSRSGEIINGKKMASNSLQDYDEHTIDIESTDVISIVCDDSLIYAVKTATPNGNKLVGIDHPGVVRPISLREYSIVGAEALIDFGVGLVSARLVGLALTV